MTSVLPAPARRSCQDPTAPNLVVRRAARSARDRPGRRATSEVDRLSRPLALRELVNDRYRLVDTPALKTRTLRSILDLSGGSAAAQTA